MLRKWSLVIMVSVVVLLVSGLFISYQTYAGECKDDDKCKEMKEGECKDMEHNNRHQHKSSEATEKSDELIKQADKMFKEAEKVTDDKDTKMKCHKALAMHCGKMVKTAQELVAQCGELLEGENPDTKKIAELNHQANKLLTKSLEMMQKTCSMMMPAKKETPQKEVWTCPMHPEIKTDKQGKCPKCGMNLEKKK